MMMMMMVMLRKILEERWKLLIFMTALNGIGTQTNRVSVPIWSSLNVRPKKRSIEHGSRSAEQKPSQANAKKFDTKNEKEVIKMSYL